MVRPPSSRGDSLRSFALSAVFPMSCRATRAASEASQVFSPVQMLALKRGWRTRDSVLSSEAQTAIPLIVVLH